MIVDDDRFLLDMYSIKFREGGHEVELCYGGEDALKKLREGATADAIILDIVMPQTDGFELLKRIREEGLGGDPALIILSNQGEIEDKKRAEEFQVDGYIVKASAIPSEVLKQVLEILKTKGK